MSSPDSIRDERQPQQRAGWALQLPGAPDATPAHEVGIPEGSAFRAVPLLEVVDAGDRRLVVVGQTRLVVSAGGATTVTFVVRALWQTRAKRLQRRDEEMAFTAFVDWSLVADHPHLAPALQSVVEALPLVTSDAQESVTAGAKILAERSRNAVTRLRSLRYALESLLAGEIRGSTKDVEGLLADVLELSIAAGRARDEARAAVREGMWTWRTDDVAYHAQRRLLDPTLLDRDPDGAGRARSWFPTFDAAVRQCVQMQSQLGEEAQTLQGMLTAASTIAVTRDARSQESLTLIAAVGGILLGVPGLVLALYGASSVLPLTGRNAVFLIPLGGAAFLAVVIAAVLPGRSWRGRLLRVGLTLLAVVVTTLLLLYAGVLYTPRP